MPNKTLKEIIKVGRPRMFDSPQQLLDTANEFMQYIDDNPIIICEQKKGNTIIPKNFEGKLSDINPIVTMPRAKPYFLESFMAYIGAGINFLNQFEELLKPNENEVDLQFSFVIKYIRSKFTSNKLEGAAAGIFNPTIISRVEGLTDKHDISGDSNMNISVNLSDPKTIDKMNNE